MNAHDDAGTLNRRLIPQIAGWFTMALGAATVLVRVRQIGSPVRPSSPDLNGMGVDAAVCFVLTGLACLASARGRALRGRWAAGLALVFVLAAVLHLPNPAAARMAPFAIVGLTAASLVFLLAGEAGVVMKVLLPAAAIAPLALGMIALAGGARGALLTAAGLIALGAGGLDALLARGPTGPETNHLARPAAPAMVIGLFLWAIFDSLLGLVAPGQDPVVRRNLILNWMVSSGAITIGLLVLFLELRKRLRAEAALKANEARLQERIQRATQELRIEIEQNREIHQQLSESERRFRLVVESASNAMIMVDMEGRIRLVNAQAEKLFGYSREEMIGSAVEMLVPEHLRARHAGHRGSFLAKQEARPMGGGMTFPGLRRDGVEVPIEIGLNPVSTADGQFVLATMVDVSEREAAEAALRESARQMRQLADELEQRVEVRTADLKRSLAEKELLLKEVHHRVKNNLQVICSLLSMQMDEAESKSPADPVAGPIREAHTRVLSMAMIHEQLYQSTTLEDVDFGVYAESLAMRLFRGYCVDPFRIRLELATEPLHLTIDQAIPCGLILNELISNTLKHAFNDGREGVIRIGFRRLASGRAELSVADTGPGLPADFDIMRVRSLGMQVVKALSEQLGARLHIASDGGTRIALDWKIAEHEDKQLSAFGQQPSSEG